MLIKFSDLVKYNIHTPDTFALKKELLHSKNYKDENLSNFGQLIRLNVNNIHIGFNLKIQNIYTQQSIQTFMHLSLDNMYQFNRLARLAKTKDNDGNHKIKVFDFNNSNINDLRSYNPHNQCIRANRYINPIQLIENSYKSVRMLSIPCQYGSLFTPIAHFFYNSAIAFIPNKVTLIHAHGKVIEPIKHIPLPEKELIFMVPHKYLNLGDISSINANPFCSIKYNKKLNQTSIKIFHNYVDISDSKLIEGCGLHLKRPEYKDLILYSIQGNKLISCNQNVNDIRLNPRRFPLQSLECSLNFCNSYYKAISSYFYGIDIFSVSKKNSVTLSQVIDLLSNDYNDRLVIRCCRGMIEAKNLSFESQPYTSHFNKSPVYTKKEEVDIRNLYTRLRVYDNLPKAMVELTINYEPFFIERINNYDKP